MKNYKAVGFCIIYGIVSLVMDTRRTDLPNWIAVLELNIFIAAAAICYAIAANSKD